MTSGDEKHAAGRPGPVGDSSPARGKWRVAIALLLLVAGVAAAAVVVQRRANGGAPAAQESAAPAAKKVPGRVAAFAWLRPRDGVLVISGPATDFGYRIDRLDVKEGDMVKAGQTLAELDVKGEREASLAVAAAQVEQAKVEVDFAKRELARKEALSKTKPPTVSIHDLDVARESEALARAKLAVAESRRTYAQIRLEQATIRAPVAGMVLHIMKHEGEGFTPGQGLIELGQVTHMEAVAEVFETDVRFVKPGEKAVFSSPALAHPVEGKVLRILPKTARVSLYMTNAAENAESRVVQVVIAFGDNPAVRRLTGLQGIVRIDTSAGS